MQNDPAILIPYDRYRYAQRNILSRDKELIYTSYQLKVIYRLHNSRLTFTI